MKNLTGVPSQSVESYWRQLESCPRPNPLRTDILDSTFPLFVEWFTGELEKVDIGHLFLLPVHDFGPLSKESWKLPPAADYFAENFYVGSYDPKFPYNGKKLANLLKWEGRRASRIIIVSDSHAGPFTILDGNHRAILLAHEDQLVGASVYIGIHPDIRRFRWAEFSYQNRC